ncbi:MAG TPA: hypothetical protein VI997_08775 [Candidatus Thermoplasmatota archaeon]|nr:hypothetical protein [Candidatus Thermoplasmatota archaeon]
MASIALLNVGVALSVAVLGLGLLLGLVSAVSWMRLRKGKFLVAGAAFLVLALKGGLATSRALADKTVDVPSVGLDFAVLAFLYASVAMR